MLKSKKEINQLFVEGAKYTIFTIDGMNLSVKYQITYKSHIFQKWAQYENSLYITARIKSKRSDSVIIFPENQELVIFEGWTAIEGVRKELERETNKIQMHRVFNKTIEEFKQEKGLLFAKGYREMFENNIIEDDRWDYEGIIDTSFDYLADAGKKLDEVKKDENYKKTLRNYLNKYNWSIDSKMMTYFRINHPYMMDTIQNLV